MPIIIASPFESGSYARVIAACGGSPLQAFCAIGSELTLRFFAQQAIAPPSEAYVQNLWQGIWESVHAEGLPEPLAPNEVGEPRTLDDRYLFTLADRALSRLPIHRTEDVLRAFCIQIFTALLSPEFRACRQSFMSGDLGGPCRRQSAEHCRDRVSGSHCEDCPFFVALSKEQHRKLLGRSFGPAGQATWNAHLDRFLPEDFRALRIFWHLHIRQPHP